MSWVGPTLPCRVRASQGSGLPVTAGEHAQLGACLGRVGDNESQWVWAWEWLWQVVIRAGTVRLPLEGLVAPRELQEEVLIQLLPAGPLPGRQEDVAPDVLVHDAAAGRHTAEGHVDVLIKLDGHLQGGGRRGQWVALPWSGLEQCLSLSLPSPCAYLPDVPVDIPLAHVAEAPGLDHVTHGQVNSDQSVVGNAQDLVFPAALEPDPRGERV